MRKIDLRELTCQYPSHISYARCQIEKNRLGADVYHLLVVEICRITCKSRDKTLQLLQNYSNSHHTDSQRALISFLWFQVICGSIAIVGFHRSHDLDKKFSYMTLGKARWHLHKMQGHVITHDPNTLMWYHVMWLSKWGSMSIGAITYSSVQ